MASKDDQIIYSPDCVPEGFKLSDPDHLNGFKIGALYMHWLQRQKKGLSPFIVLKGHPHHGESGRTPVARNFVNNESVMPIRPVCIMPISFDNVFVIHC